MFKMGTQSFFKTIVEAVVIEEGDHTSTHDENRLIITTPNKIYFLFYGVDCPEQSEVKNRKLYSQTPFLMLAIPNKRFLATMMRHVRYAVNYITDANIIEFTAQEM